MSKLAVANIIFETTESNRIEYTGNNVVRVRANGGVQLPFGTTAQRASPEYGLLRYNTDTGTVEMYDAGGWFNMPTGGYVNNIYTTANAAYALANNVAPQIAPSYNNANAAFRHANAAYDSANNVAPQVTPAFNTANLAFLNSNVAFDTANAAFASANNVAPQVTPAFNTANLAFINSNVAFNTANAAFASANNVAPQVAPAYLTANLGYAAANAAYTSSNSVNTYSDSTYVKLTAPNQTITGNLSVTGALTILGNTTSISSNNLIVGDSMIYLAANNYSGTDILDIGFVANYANGTGANVHTGLIRDATNKQYYLFQGLDIELFANNTAFTPGANGAVNAVLNADLVTSNLSLGGANAINWITSAYGTSNSAYGTVNASYGFANSAYASINSNWTVTNTTADIANAAFAKANSGMQNTTFTLNGSLTIANTNSIAVPIWYENETNITASYTVTAGRNAMTAGPVTLNTGVTITVPVGSTWTVV